VAGGLARAAVFGVSDGLVSNISLVLGVAGGGVDPSVVRLAGIAGLIAGAVSMAAGEFVSVSAQNELIERELEVERRELRNNPEAELTELSKLYEAKGVPPERARQVANDIMSDADTALAVHAREELGINPDELASPWLTALWSFLAFAVGAILPIIPWFLGGGGAAQIASLVIGIAAATVVGSLIGRFAERGVPRSAIRQVLILLLACGVTWIIGRVVGVSVS
jgi:VIT1/CCC1 family predicted Fe2+/Mn2+ transporter